MLSKTTWLITGLRVSPQRMQQNLELTKGLIFSGQVLLDLAAAGMLREHAYKVVQGHAMQSWEQGTDFRSAIEADPEIRNYLTPERIAESFAVSRYLVHVDRIFERVFGGTV
jgi:adenylosuccinate lyase